MAKKSLSQAKYVERGYGQVEPNHLSARRTGQIYAQLPAAKDIDVLENGQFAKYDYANGVVNFSTEEDTGEWMLVFNEIKLYEDRQHDEDFAMLRENYTATVYNAANDMMPDGTVMTPRLLKTNLGDIMTSNMVDEDELDVTDILKVGPKGILSKSGTSEMAWQVVKVYTMPDGQRGVKLMRVK